MGSLGGILGSAGGAIGLGQAQNQQNSVNAPVQGGGLSQWLPEPPKNASKDKTTTHKFKAADGYYYESEFESLFKKPDNFWGINRGAFTNAAQAQMNLGVQQLQNAIIQQLFCSQNTTQSGTNGK